MKIKLLITISILTITFLFYLFGRSIWHPVIIKIMGKKTVEQVIAKYDTQTQNNLSALFEDNGISYPPNNLALIAFKDVAVLEVWASNDNFEFKKITEYSILAASGKLGPKLVEGDRQVPEGIYQIIGFNPNSAYHLSMKLNYPNKFDLKYANAEGREFPGSNIFIHGKSASIGCLAMGDPAIEDLFTLVYQTGKTNTQVIISPTDPSQSILTPPDNAPIWTQELYNNIENSYRKITGLPLD